MGREGGRNGLIWCLCDYILQLIGCYVKKINEDNVEKREHYEAKNVLSYLKLTPSVVLSRWKRKIQPVRPLFVSYLIVIH